MSDLIRIAPGQVSAYDLLNTSSYLVKNWTRTSDMSPATYWSASQPEKPLEREVVASLGIGGGGFYGLYSGQFNIFLATPLMRQYLFETVMQSKPIAPVTVYMQASQGAFEDMEFQVLYGEMQRIDYTRFDDRLYHTIQFEFRRGRVLTMDAILLEDASSILLEDGTELLLEAQV